MVDEMISVVRAAFAPGADAATKQQAAAILRGLLTMLDAGGAGPVASTPTVQPLAAPGSLDVLTAIVDSVRSLLPPEALSGVTRFRVPLIRSGGSGG